MTQRLAEDRMVHGPEEDRSTHEELFVCVLDGLVVADCRRHDAWHSHTYGPGERGSYRPLATH